MEKGPIGSLVIAGRFVVERSAGSGGMGEVYRARDLTTDAIVALKLLASDSGEPERQRFSREAQVLRNLRHPNIVSYIDHGMTEEHRPYLVMEWLQGEDLETRLRRGALPLGEALSLLRGLCAGLAAAHGAGVIHRDIKPANIFLRSGDGARAVLLDFGMARRAQTPPMTATGALLGTPAYMAPEQARGARELTSAADVFSLGCVFFECLTGQPPFVGQHIPAVLAKIRREDAPRLAERWAGAPAPLDGLLGRMLAREPGQRPADAVALCAELRALDAMLGDKDRPSLGRPTPCLGREAELSAIEGLLSTCQEESSARALLVTAPSGFGKSRLLHELLRRLAARPGAITLLMGRGDPATTASGDTVLGQALRQLCEMLDGDLEGERRRKLRARISAHVDGADVPHTAEFLGALCGVSFPDEDCGALRTARQDARAMREGIRQALLSFLAAECRNRTLLLVLDDLHAVDATTVQLVEEALLGLPHYPMLVLGFGRPQVREQLPRLFGGAHLDLRPLGRRASERIVREILGDAAVPDVVAGIVEKAQGNARLLAELAEQGKTSAGSQDRIGQIDERAAPPQAVISPLADTAIASAQLAASERSSPEGGTRLGPFRIESQLGLGGMGVVYRAFDERLHRWVALKLLGPAFANDLERRSRFLREARLAAAVNHPSIAVVHEVGELDGQIFIAMELVEGGSLRERLQGPISPNHAIQIGEQISEALVCAHQKGVVHRDLKPENVMVGPKLQVKILDFGLAKRPDAAHGEVATSLLTKVGQFVGTPGYMAPEQALGHPIDHRADLYSLGVILYEMATGTRPFDGTVQEQLVATIHDQPQSSRKINPRIPVELEQLILRCVAKEPAERPGSAQEVLAALREIAQVLEQPSQSTAPVPRSLPVRPQRAIRPLFGVLAVLVLCSVALWGVRARRSSSLPAATPTRVTDLTLPPWARTEAVADYRGGLQLEHDAAEAKAWSRFMEAAASDPRLAQPHLRLALNATRGRPAQAREHFAKATELRSTLSPRDELLLEAIAPCVQNDILDNAECARRLSAAADRFPTDAEFPALAGEFYLNCGRLEEAIAYSRRAIELDPGYATAMSTLGYANAYAGRRDEALRALQRCGEAAPDGFSCYSYRDDLYAEDGRCDLIEADAHKAVAVMPSLAQSYALLADAYVATGKPLAAVREVVRQQIQRTPEAERAIAETSSEARLAALEGDFASVEKRAREWDRLASASPDEEAHAAPTRLLVEAYQEMGRVREAAAVAGEFLARRSAWIPDARGDDFAIQRDPTPLLVAAQLRAGQLTQLAWAETIATYIARWKRSAPPLYVRYLWLHGLAAPVETPAEARAALAELPRYQPLPVFMPTTLAAFYVGKTYLLAGDADRAIPYLTAAARNCFSAQHPFDWVRAHLLRGQALQAKGDRSGACAAYGVVLAHWGKARSVSVSARDARGRAAFLRCAL